ncbi:MAG: ribonuclease P protein component [Bifidobacterium psychraerophilum]|uniref:ribonuclease P protein component n=1 Tax=Bifidobacterium psychraerophilum TaxID=218140 RepID=UPI0039EB7F90
MERLRSHSDFVAVLKHRNKVVSRDLVVHYYARTQDKDENYTGKSQRRLGLAVSKSVGNAVVRNHVKRRFRQLANEQEDLLPQCCDIVMRARPHASRAPFEGLRKQVGELFADIDNRSHAEKRHSRADDDCTQRGRQS